MHVWYIPRVGRENFKVITDRLVLSDQFGYLEFPSAKWAPSNQQRLSFFMGRLHACDLDYDEVIAQFRSGSVVRPAVVRKKKTLYFFFDPKKLLLSHIHKKCLAQKKPFFVDYPFIYDQTSAETHFMILQMLSAFQKWSQDSSGLSYPEWPQDLSLLSILKLLIGCGLPAMELGIFTGPWPKRAKSLVCLSHDVDDRVGYDNMEMLLNVERGFGYRATYNIPGMRYEVDMGYLKSLEEGFEIGIHGYKHRSETPFLEPEVIDARLKESMERFKGLKIQGYRSPALRRTERLLSGLEKYFQYDSSVPDTENHTQSRDFNGCSIPYPFFVGSLLEIPITVPQDGVLMALKYSPEKILETWKTKILSLKDQGALIVLNTHPDPVFSGKPAMARIYGELLKFISRDRELHVSTLGELNGWVRKKCSVRSSSSSPSRPVQKAA